MDEPQQNPELKEAQDIIEVLQHQRNEAQDRAAVATGRAMKAERELRSVTDLLTRMRTEAEEPADDRADTRAERTETLSDEHTPG